MTTATSPLCARKISCCPTSRKVFGVKTGIASRSAVACTAEGVSARPRRPAGCGGRAYTARTSCPCAIIAFKAGTANCGVPMKMTRISFRFDAGASRSHRCRASPA